MPGTRSPCFWGFGVGIPDSGFQIPDFQIQIPESRFPIQDSGFPVPDSGFRRQDRVRHALVTELLCGRRLQFRK